MYSAVGQNMTYAHWNVVVDLGSSSAKDAQGSQFPPGLFVADDVLYIVFFSGGTQECILYVDVPYFH